ncbi:hypothetical protein H4R21_000654 [Coemansia helicoidea]|uniref:Uncharacterized protein n=1 Tax=Coemansia helicoidea TaxID=1286919 RepID=A0ACC1LEC3_9FUNG|nr:hypothetical protein H4R21_000654 [Coemansia helicoidea]
MSNAGGQHDNTSQLFAFDSSVALAELLGSDDPLSVQHFEESLRDEHADSLFLDSQLSFGLFESQMSLRGAAQAAAGEADWSQPEHFALGDPPAWLLPHTPSSALLQRLDATPPTASQGSHWAASVRSAALRASQPTPTSVGRIRVEGNMPVVLAEETPAAHSHGSKRKLEFFVPETPLPAKGARRLPAGPQQPRAADTPVMRRSASSGISWVVPETPAARETPVQQASKAARNKAHERYHPLAMAGSIRLDQALLERRRRHTRELRLSRTATHAEAPGIPALALGLARSSSSTAGADDAAAGSGDA